MDPKVWLEYGIGGILLCVLVGGGIGLRSWTRAVMAMLEGDRERVWGLVERLMEGLEALREATERQAKAFERLNGNLERLGNVKGRQA